MAPKLVIIQTWKSSKFLKKKNFSEKNLSTLFVQIVSSKHCVEIFLHKWVSRYLTFGDFTVPKNFSSP